MGNFFALCLPTVENEWAALHSPTGAAAVAPDRCQFVYIYIYNYGGHGFRAV